MNKTTDKILSIIVPTYNMELYLERCLKSFILDNINDIEVLVINDGSKDNSSKIAHKYADLYPDIFTVIDKSNGGYGSTINTGIQIANGKYLKVCDSDDWFDNNAFNIYLKELRNIDADLVYNSYSKEYVNENRSEDIKCPLNSSVQSFKVYNIDEINFERLLSLPEITYKTKVLKDININLFENTLYTDLQFVTFPIKSIKSISFINVCLYKYFIGRVDQSISLKSKERNIKHMEKVVLSLINYRESNILSNKKLELVNHLIAEVYATILSTYLIGFAEDRQTAMLEYKKIRKNLKDNYSNIYLLILAGNLTTNRIIRIYEKLPLVSIVLPYIYKIKKYFR